MSDHVPSWLQAAADQRVALLLDKLPKAVTDKLRTTVIMTTLTEPDENATELERQQWEHACDNCGKVLAPGFQVRHLEFVFAERNVRLTVTIGACGECWEAP